ncbi:hypothetical protein KQX54_010984 [Cotesia glomerata]|uniref:Uncharacterized protein n=1 Tax=Cotesia glomerata TaxID=32391 RepID=A0AAV7J4K7_COTGL|nr:hypothetical protein KQX54_010984 [Cotesia glomerata]
MYSPRIDSKEGWESVELENGKKERRWSVLDHRTSTSEAVSADKDWDGDGQDGRPTGLSTTFQLYTFPASAFREKEKESFLGILIYTPSTRLTPIVPFHSR